MSSLQVIFIEPAKVLLTQIGAFLIRAIAVIFILVIGWWLSKLIKTAATKVSRFLKFDDIATSTGIDRFLAKGGISYSLAELIGVVCYWLALLVIFMIALTPFNLITPSLLDKVISYIPNVIAAIFILILGMFAATILKNIMQTAANNAGLSQGKLLSKVSEVAVIAFAIFIALEQLKIGIRITELTLSILLGSIGLAAALAFGFGCQDIAKKFISELIENLKSKK